MSRPSSHANDGDKALSVVHVNIKSDDVFQYITQTDLERKITETSLYNDTINRKPFNDDLIRCYAITADKEHFGIRVNTILSYCAANQKVNLMHDKDILMSAACSTTTANFNFFFLIVSIDICVVGKII